MLELQKKKNIQNHHPKRDLHHLWISVIETPLNPKTTIGWHQIEAKKTILRQYNEKGELSSQHMSMTMQRHKGKQKNVRFLLYTGFHHCNHFNDSAINKWWLHVWDFTLQQLLALLVHSIFLIIWLLHIQNRNTILLTIFTA